MKVSQSAIAKKLSVSVGTVSKSLRNDSAIHPETRAQVVELASRMGYRLPSSRSAERVAKNAKLNSFCMMLQSDTDLESNSGLRNAAAVLAGVSEAGHAADAVVSIHYVPLKDIDRADRPEHQPVALREGILSGLILHHYFPSHVIRSLGKLVPTVVISRSNAMDPVDGVDCDAPHTMSLLVRHLAERGHRRIGFIAGLSHHAWHQDRFGAFVQAMVASGLAFDPTIAQGAQPDGEADVERIVRCTRDGVTAWVTASDSTAYAWCKKLEAHGLRVGLHFAMVGVDASAPPEGMPRLTSVDLPFAAMGRASISLLLERIRDPAVPLRRLMIQGHLVEGESTPSVAALRPNR